MKNKIYIPLLLASMALGVSSDAQIVSGNLFLQGRFLEIGSQDNGSLGSSTNAPSGYHYNGYTTGTGSSISLCGASRSLAHVYDYGMDGWTSGTPKYMGDYSLPGSPWEGWMIEQGGSAAYAYSTTCGWTGSFSGSFTSYSSSGGRMLGYWSGTGFSGSALRLDKEYRIDTNSSALVVTVKFKNNSTSTLPGIYYMRSLDPDQAVPWGGSFTTVNTVNYQNDYYHRVMVSATASGSSTSSTGSPPAPIGLGTKDCRCKAVIYRSWPMSTSVLPSSVWAGSASVGGAYYTPGSTTTGDIAIGLVCKIGDLSAGDSAVISYAYIYNGVNGIDSAFPQPQMQLLGSTYDSFASVCATDSFGVNIINASDKTWTWSDWTWSPSIGLSATTGLRNTVNVRALSTTTTYTITGTDTNAQNCAQKIFILTVYPGDPNPPTVTDVYYCEGDAAGPLTATGVNLLWYTTATGGTGSTVAPTPSTSTPGIFTYYVSQEPCPGNESGRAPIRVYVTPRPVLTASNDGPHCAGETLRLYANDTGTFGTRTYIWSGPSGFSSTLRNPVRTGTSVIDSGVYAVVLSVNGCVSRPATTVAVVHYTPPPPSVSNVTYCQYATASRLTATGSNLEWYATRTSTTGSSTAPTPRTNPAGVDSYYVSQTVNGCEGPRAVIAVTINAKPDTPVVTPQSYCQFETAVPAAASGSSLRWYGPGLPSGGSTTAPTPSTAVAAVYVYSVTQTVLGCTSDPALVTIKVKAQPSAPITVDTSLCQNDPSIRLMALGTSLRWYTTSTGGVAIDTIPMPPTTVIGATTYYVAQVVDGCYSPRAALTFRILPSPVFGIVSSEQYVCQYDTLTLAYNGTALYDSTYTWSLPVGARLVGGSLHDSVIQVYFDSLRFQTVKLAVANFRRCVTVDSYAVRVIYQPSAAFYIPENVCKNDTVTIALSSRSANAQVFTWGFSGANIITRSSDDGGPYKLSWPTTGLKTISMRVFSVEGCEGKSMVDSVKVRSLPDARIGRPSISGKFCLEDSLFLVALTEVEGFTYRWSPEHFFNNSNRGRIWGRIERRGYITLRVTDPFGCTAEDSIKLDPEECCTVRFPTAFTPNNDGRNDRFRPVFAGYHRFHTFRIVNRWGQVVFETTNSNESWDGTYGGVPQDMGTYYYMLKYDCGDGNSSGSSEGNGNGGNGSERVEKGEVILMR